MMEDMANNFTLESLSYESNRLTNSIDRLIAKVSNATNGEVQLSNIGQLYQKAVLNMVTQLKKSGLNYFDMDEFSLFNSIQEFLEKHLKNGISQFDGIVERVTNGWPLDKIEECLDIYKKECSFMDSFDLIRNLDDILKHRYSTNLYSLYPPGAFRATFQEDLKMISKFASIDVVAKIKDRFEKLVEEKEATAQDYDNNILVNF